MRASHRDSHFPVLRCLIFFLLSFVIYVAMYPAWLRIENALRGGVVVHVGGVHFYTPVEKLIERTPLRQPMLAWCEVWGVREQVVTGCYYRTGDEAFADNYGFFL